MRIRLAIVAVMILAVVGVLGARAAWQAGRSAPQVFDLLILNGRVLDGSGNPWLREDLGIRGDRIVARGRLEGSSATRVLDAQGLIVAPGFIDVHSHASGSLARETLREAQGLLAQGITTVVVNPDGGGPVDVAAQRQALAAGGIGVNVAQLIGHGSVRGAVMDSARRAPTTDELATSDRAVSRAAAECQQPTGHPPAHAGRPQSHLGAAQGAQPAVAGRSNGTAHRQTRQDQVERRVPRGDAEDGVGWTCD